MSDFDFSKPVGVGDVLCNGSINAGALTTLIGQAALSEDGHQTVDAVIDDISTRSSAAASLLSSAIGKAFDVHETTESIERVAQLAGYQLVA